MEGLREPVLFHFAARLPAPKSAPRLVVRSEASIAHLVPRTSKKHWLSYQLLICSGHFAQRLQKELASHWRALLVIGGRVLKQQIGAFIWIRLEDLKAVQRCW